MNTFIFNTMFAGAIPHGKAKVTLSDDQAMELYIDLGAYLRNLEKNSKPSDKQVREFFFEEEGYMVTDEVAKAYWDNHHE